MQAHPTLVTAATSRKSSDGGEVVASSQPAPAALAAGSSCLHVALIRGES